MFYHTIFINDSPPVCKCGKEYIMYNIINLDETRRCREEITGLLGYCDVGFSLKDAIRMQPIYITNLCTPFYDKLEFTSL